MPASRLRRRSRVLTALLVILSTLLQIGFQPVARAATSVTLDFPMPEGFDRADLTAWASEFNDRNDLLSETIQEEIAAHPADFPGAEDLEPREFDGAFTVTATGLSVTIEADVHIGDLTWWEEVLMWVSVTAGGVVFRIACVLTLVPVMANPNFAKGICAGLAVLISKGLVLLITALKHGPSDDWHFWERALAALLLEAVTAAIWDAWLGPWTAKNSWTSVYKTIGDGFESVANTVARWWGSSAGFFRTLAHVVRGRGPGTTASTVERAMELGWMPRTTALRVMPLGDSITHGVGGNPGGVGYRARLWDLLQDDTSTLDFVGSVDSGQGHLPDTDHEGHPRWWVSQIDALAAECAIARYRPNVVVLHIGTNDLANGQDHLTTLARFGDLINNIHDVAPLTTIIVSSLVPSTTAATNSRIALFNAYLATAVTTWLAEGKRVRLVSNGELEVTTADLADTLHPNNNGYRKMADAYHNEIRAALAANQIMPALSGDNRPCTPAPGNPTPPPPPGPGPAGWDYVGKIASVPGATRAQVRFADLNGDGRDDYLLVGDQGQVKAWLNNRAGQGGGWNYAGEVASGAASRDRVRFADINGDGRDDYLSVGDGGEVSAWLNVGTGNAVSWASKGVVATGVGATRDQVRFADVDVDGRDDYLVVDGQGKVRAWLNGYTAAGGAWTFRGEIASGVGASGNQVRFHDLDGDGDDDYSVFDDSGYVRAWLNNVGGNRPWIYQGTVVGGAGVGPAGLLMADIDGNGREDFLTVNDAGEVAAWLNDRWGRPDPWDYQGQIASTDAPRQEVRFADLNGDGRDDYLLVGDQGRVQAWLNVREADRVGWNHRGEVASGSGPRDHIRFADLNGDGRDDYLVVGDQGQVTAWFNSGTGDAVAWSSKGRLASGSAPRDQIRFADVDGDNRDDYLVVDDQGRVRFWRNTGTGDGVSWSSQGEIASGVGAAGATVTFADVNGDRKDDYLVIGDYGQLRAWINNRGGSGSAWIAAGEIAAGVGAARADVTLAEINGDRRADYLVHDTLGGVKAWFNNGASAPSGSATPMPGDPQPASPGDLPLCVANRCQ
ncbi:FG-GAP-like repeat-containing protein [Herbidospora yilanensis]|uniref:FG-GAP-like repeat-containing protein n=1 Tax=Herbidospora yilanensis TaxID=354426 RepID=UPI0007822BC7|nr:FG-GAP-like repeat-containing protein [Herbidospora yilanensis]